MYAQRCSLHQNVIFILLYARLRHRDLELRRGEVLVDCLTEVEDTKGNVS